ncbi:MAG: hypothetical protein DMG25_01665 [Acidobacteria bacterium]|nr:MAG: hypothetical protein DMG25_01665 [Acidobacteriota bacterium]
MRVQEKANTMKPFGSRSRWLVIVLGGSLAVACLAAVPGTSADYGRVSGTVKDTEGNPLMGATVLLMGPLLSEPVSVAATAERVITDANGKFKVERLLPGWYSLKVTSPTRLPSLRNGIRVAPGQTARQDFVLSDVFAPVRFRVPEGIVTTWGDDWKWVLRTSASTRPVLRYRETAQSAPADKGAKKCALASQRLIGMTPGSAHGDPLAEDPGLGSVLAYLRPISDDADLLVAGSMTSNGIEGSSLATAFRRNLLDGNPQELAFIMHELSYSEALPLPANENRANLGRAQGVVVSYANTRRLSSSMTLTTGFEVDYLNSARDAVAARPRAALEYQVTPATAVAFRYGSIHIDGENTLLDRIGELNAFPRVTVQGYRPKLEKLNHAEASVDRHLSKTSRVEVAAYRDSFENTAVWGSGPPDAVAFLAGSVLPNPVAAGWTMNAGNYQSSGFRAAYSRQLGNRVEAAAVYSLGQALAANPALASNSGLKDLRSALREDRSESVGGRVSARVPMCKTRVTASYEWLPHGRVTSVDPYGEASLGVHPYLDLQIRQPLPSVSFIPAHIEALADFRNLLAQGYVPVLQSGEKPLLLAPAYRSFRGGFSLLF